jgi:hypothetical protein
MAEATTGEVAVTGEWTFRRRDDRLIVRREHEGDGDVWLSVVEPSTTRRYRFESLDRLIAFQSDMESFLVRTGWSLEAFAPERRTGRDRRQMPRVDNDRRRWWTDAKL